MDTKTLLRPLCQEELEASLAAVRIPACPQIVTEAMREAQKDDPSIHLLTRILTSDVGLSAAALKLANSPMFGSGAKARSVQQAATRLGIGNILNVIVATALRNSITGLPTDLLHKFWSHASALAVASGVLARLHVGISAEKAYTLGLFQDAAIPVLMSTFPAYTALYAQAPGRGHGFMLDEQAHFCCDHAVVGWLIAKSWGLSSELAAAIRFHHDREAYNLPETELPADALALIAVTTLAEFLLAEFSDDGQAPDEEAVNDAIRHMGTSESDLDEYRDVLGEAFRST